ncbi:hypothetical protein LOTGIDRAFT_103320 [Lottia gigantea]|uniref:Ecm29 proteasome adaptor and scaffold n=1 Tax=Lottia gigantea TaxID=225164 RepID=V4B4F0_LOTGI|nr:hypothetical protein LOTGIDRAFT_103320 [Lottia gigantea]ESP05333.1 hypothetical protein LOTGIDRAFT_103320 [Lottia gigantea]
MCSSGTHQYLPYIIYITYAVASKFFLTKLISLPFKTVHIFFFSALVERVFLRIGSADTDEQLEVALGKFLTPILLKLNSSEDGIRTKVMELLVHINKRLKSRSKVQLPVESLLTQFQDPTATPFVTNFTILYIKMGFPRLDPVKQAELLPMLINCLEGRPSNQKDSLLLLMIPAIQHLKFPSDLTKRKSMFQLADKPEITKLLLDFMMDILLLTYSAHASAQAARSGGGAGGRGPPVTVPPGLSENSLKRVLGENPMTPEGLEKAKLGILNFLGAGILSDNDLVCHYIVASSDTRHSVATSADMELKRIMGSIDWNSKEIISKLYKIFQGTVVLKGQVSIEGCRLLPEDRRVPVCTRIRLKIFPFFLKSKEAVGMFPSCIQVVFDCLFGTNLNAKLRVMAVQFVHHICYNCEDSKFKMFDAVLLSGMIKLIGEAKEDSKLRSLAYVAVGKIARRSPDRVAKDMTLIQQFFQSVCEEDTETRLAVQEALSLMSEAFKKLDETNLKLLEALIMQYIDKVEPQARLVAVQYAIAVFPSNHIPSRYILLLASGDNKDDIRGESIKELNNTENKDGVSLELPQFINMIQYIKEKAQQRKESNQKYVSGNTVLPFNPTTYTQMIIYLRMCLIKSAGGKKVVQTTDEILNESPLLSHYVNQLLSTYTTNDGPIQTYINMIKDILSVNSDSKTMFCLLEVVAVAADKLSCDLLSNVDWLMSYVFSPKEDLRLNASQLYAILIFHSNNHSLISDTLHELYNNIQSKSEVKIQLGSILTLGYIIGQKLYSKYQDVTIEDMDHTSIHGQTDNIRDIVIKIVSIMTSGNANLSSAACIALGEIGRNGSLPLPSGGDGDNQGQITIMSVIKHFLSILQKSDHSNKMKEKAAMALGYICIGDVDFPHRKHVMSELFNAVTGKQVDLHFTIGEALVCVAEGKKSVLARDLWREEPEEYTKKHAEIKDEMKYYLDQILTVYIPHSNQHLRQAACIWLLILLRKSGHHPVIQKKIIDIQKAFMRLLSENDDITQDIASKGLGLVFDICTQEQKDLLVSTLVDTLTTGKSTKHEVTSDTTVFAEGSIGKAPDGGGLSTYKELCSIANDLNQPDLVYKFMHLAHHNAVWNSRKGAAFGFSTIAAQAGEQLAPFLPQMVPKLYRYQFDPNPKIQQAMSSIWNALVKDNKKTVEIYMKQILDDLIKNLTSNQWRIRESSCLAVNDLLRGRNIDDIIEQLPELWQTLLRVRDDIKESVRTAAHTACKTLSRVSVKICDINNGKVGERAIQSVLPCLLTNTLNSTVKEVRQIGLSTILDISKNSGKLLKPHIPVLVIALLEAVSGLEPQVLNYYSLHMGSQDTQEKLDSARISYSKTSPMMETVSKCVQYVDDTILPELVPRLCDLIKSGIGVATKAGCSSFTISLVHHCPNDLAPYAGKLMASFLNGACDRNLSVRKYYSSALGHLSKIAKDSSVEKLIARIKSWYLEKEDENAHSASGLILHAMNRHSPDALQRNAALAMPLAFFAMHQKINEDETSKQTIKIWQDVWNETTPSTESGVRLYLGEIVSILQSSLDSQSWTTKAQAAVSMTTLATESGTNLSSPHLNQILQALISGLQGRTWGGKEELLKALSTVCTSCREAISNEMLNNQPAIHQITDCVLKECRKEKSDYRLEAWKCMSAVLEEYEIDKFQDMWDIMIPVLQKVNLNQKDDDEAISSNLKESNRECIYLCLGQCWPYTSSVQDDYKKKLLDLLLSSLPLSTWKVQVSILKSLNTYIER